MQQLPDKILEIEAAIARAERDGRHCLALELNQEWVQAAIADFCSRSVPPLETKQCVALDELLSTIEAALDVRAGADMETANLQAAYGLTVGLIEYNLRREDAPRTDDALEGVAALVRSGEVLGRLRGWAVPVLTGILDRAAESERVLYLQTVVAPPKAAATKTRWVPPAIFGFEAYEFLKQVGEHSAEDEAYAFAEKEGFNVPQKRTTLSLHLKNDAYQETIRRAKQAVINAAACESSPPDEDGALAFRALAYMRAHLHEHRDRISPASRTPHSFKVGT